MNFLLIKLLHLQDLTAALDLCLLALEACSSVVSPAATLLLSGASEHNYTVASGFIRVKANQPCTISCKITAHHLCASAVLPHLPPGPLARRLRQHLSEVATGLETLCSRTTELSGSALLAPSATLRGIILKVLDAREQCAAALAKSLGAHSGAGPAAASCVISALKAEGMTDSELRDPEVSSALCGCLGCANMTRSHRVLTSTWGASGLWVQDLPP